MGPDASWWDGQPRDDLGEVPRTVPALEAEVRRLRAELLRCQDVLSEGLESKRWPSLLAAARRAWAVAELALTRRRTSS